MSKKQIIVFITMLVIIFCGIITCGLLALKDFQDKIFSNVSFKRIISELDVEENNDEAKKNYKKTSNSKEVTVQLNYLEESTKENTNLDNVFKVEIDLNNYKDKSKELEEVKYYPYIKDSGAYGYKDINGKAVTNESFEYAESFYEGLALVVINGVDCFINSNFKVIIELEPNQMVYWGFENGLAIIKDKNDDMFVIDKEGTEILRGSYDDIDIYYNGIIATITNEHVEYYTTKGKKINIGNKYEISSGFVDGIAEVWSESEGIRFINEDGNFISIDGVLRYDSFYNGIAMLELEDKYVYINRNFEVIPFKDQYDDIFIYNYGNIYSVINLEGSYENNDAYVYIDNNGNILFKSKYLSNTGFINGKTPVYDSDASKSFFLNEKGDFVSRCDYKDIYQLNENLFYVVDDDKEGIVNSDGQLITAIEYDYIYDMEGIIYGYKDDFGDKADIFDKYGKVIASCDYGFYIIDSETIFINTNDEDDGYYMNINTGKTIEYKDKSQSL